MGGNFYPRPPGGGRPGDVISRVALVLISIHALRVEGDLSTGLPQKQKANFYPRPPGGGRPQKQFNENINQYFYPRPPGGGRRLPSSNKGILTPFLSTPSGWRATRFGGISAVSNSRFLSTPSGWRATGLCNSDAVRLVISIHALRVEGDLALGYGRALCAAQFLSTPSGWRATVRSSKCCSICASFLSTPSGWRATNGS